ncbi:MAG: aquaporin [Balneolaceae bacterium]
MRKYVMEAIGTFFLAIAMGLTGNALAIGLMLAAMIYTGMHISGAHFNPAVSFAYFIRRKITLNTFLGYLISQSLGAFAAAGVILFLANDVFYLEPPVSTDIYEQGITELLLTMALVLTYLNVASTKVLASGKSYGLVIGLVLSGMIYLGFNISGAVFNPAISIGTSAVDFLAIQGASFQYIPLYTIAPIAGGTLATLLYQYLND